MTAHALQVAGAPTVQCPAAVRTEAPAPRRMGVASVPLASEDPYARESAHQGSTVMAAPSPVPSACTAAGPATTSVASVNACQDSLEPCATKCVLEGTLGRTVPNSVPVPTTGPAAPSMAPASASLGGLARTAHRVALQHFLGRIVGTYASVRMEPAVTTSLGNAPVEQASPGATVNRDVPREPLDTGVSSCVSA